MSAQESNEAEVPVGKELKNETKQIIVLVFHLKIII